MYNKAYTHLYRSFVHTDRTVCLSLILSSYSSSCSIETNSSFACAVTPAVAEPLPGWVDNMNGPTGVLIGAGKGVIRSMICNGELKSEVVPVDIAINGLILIPYHNSRVKDK